MATIAELVKQYAEVRSERMALEHQADDIKKGREAALKQAIMAEFAAQGLKTANIPDVGRVTIKTTNHYEIQDLNLLAYRQFELLLAAAKEGRPLSDGLLFQSRVHRENLENYLTESHTEADNVAKVFGVACVGRDDLSFTRS